MSNIRVTYTGLIAFIFAIITIFTSMIFNLILTRTLSIDDYGTWGLISGFLTYAVVIEPIIGYWSAREIARKIESGKTAVISSGLLSSGGMLIFIICAFFIGNQIEINIEILFFAIILIPPRFINGTLAAINQGWKPHTISYGITSNGITQIPIALLLVYYFEMGVQGVIISVFTGLIVSNIVLGWFAKERISREFKIKYLVKWLKMVWLPSYFAIPGIIYRFDVLVFSVISGSVIGLAYWTAALAISTIISHSGLIARAIYPKMLQGQGDNLLQNNFTLFFYFSIPLTGLIIAFARPALYTLNPEYSDSFIILIYLSLQVFFTTLGGVIEQTLLGKDEVDINEKSSMKDYIKSRLFQMPTLEMIQHTIYLILLIVGLLILVSSESSLQLVIFWTMLSMSIRIPFTLYRYRILRRSVSFKFEKNSVLKYLLSGVVVFSVFFIIQDSYLTYNSNLIEFLPNFLFFIIMSIMSYLIITYIIDDKTRILTKSIIKELKNN